MTAAELYELVKVLDDSDVWPKCLRYSSAISRGMDGEWVLDLARIDVEAAADLFIASLVKWLPHGMTLQRVGDAWYLDRNDEPVGVKVDLLKLLVDAYLAVKEPQ